MDAAYIIIAVGFFVSLLALVKRVFPGVKP